MVNELTREDVLGCCGACSWAHEVWCVHRGFQDELPTEVGLGPQAYDRCGHEAEDLY